MPPGAPTLPAPLIAMFRRMFAVSPPSDDDIVAGIVWMREVLTTIQYGANIKSYYMSPDGVMFHTGCHQEVMYIDDGFICGCGAQWSEPTE
jgi:hypothetical protein